MGAESNGNGGQVLPDERELQSILESAGVPSDRTGLDRIRWMATELTRLRPLAEDGKTYRVDLINAAELEAVRAMGAEAGAEQRAMLEQSSIGLIKSFTTSWRAIADAKLPSGRKSGEDAPIEDGAFVWKKPSVGL